MPTACYFGISSIRELVIDSIIHHSSTHSINLSIYLSILLFTHLLYTFLYILSCLSKTLRMLNNLLIFNEYNKIKPHFIEWDFLCFLSRKSNGRYFCRTFSFPYFYYTMGLNFRVQNFSKKIDDFLIFYFSLLILKDYFLLKICIKIDENMKFYVFCYKKTGQKSVKKNLF